MGELNFRWHTFQKPKFQSISLQYIYSSFTAVYRGCSTGWEWTFPGGFPTTGCHSTPNGETWCFCDGDNCNDFDMTSIVSGYFPWTVIILTKSLVWMRLISEHDFVLSLVCPRMHVWVCANSVRDALIWLVAFIQCYSPLSSRLTVLIVCAGLGACLVSYYFLVFQKST